MNHCHLFLPIKYGNTASHTSVKKAKCWLTPLCPLHYTIITGQWFSGLQNMYHVYATVCIHRRTSKNHRWTTNFVYKWQITVLLNVWRWHYQLLSISRYPKSIDTRDPLKFVVSYLNCLHGCLSLVTQLARSISTIGAFSWDNGNYSLPNKNNDWTVNIAWNLVFYQHISNRKLMNWTVLHTSLADFWVWSAC